MHPVGVNIMQMICSQAAFCYCEMGLQLKQATEVHRVLSNINWVPTILMAVLGVTAFLLPKDKSKREKGKQKIDADDAKKTN